ncbi:MAG: phospholipid carrier-dependent glycosyltransferase [Chloroflexota bacterium]
MLKKREGTRLLLALITILLLFGLITAYFWVHKPFDLPLLVGLGRTIGTILVWLGLLWLAMGIGQFLGRWLDWSVAKKGLLSHLALSCGLGLAVLSLLTLLLGLVGLLQPLVAWGMVLLLGMLFRGELTAVRRTLQQKLVQSQKIGPILQPQTRFEKLLAVYIISTLTLTFLHALTPETAWDSLLYHLTGPELYIATGRIHHNIDFPLLGFPQLIEMQYLLGMLLIGDGVAPLLHFSYGLMGFALAARLANQLFGREVAWLTAVILFSAPALLDQLADAYVDIALLYYATAVFTLFWQWQNAESTKNSTDLIAIGLFCGFASSTKYTGTAIPVALALTLAWASRQAGWQVVVKRLGIITAVTILTIFPGLLENWLTTGNPVYPFLFDGPFWNPWRAWHYAQPHFGLLLTDPWQLFLAPFTATILGTTGTDAFGATIGPFILGGLFFLPLVWRNLTNAEKRKAGQLLLFVGVTYLLWLAGMARSGQLQRTRLILLPAFGITAVLSALALSKLSTLTRSQLNVQWLVRVVLAFTLLLLSLTHLGKFVRFNPLPVIIGTETANQYRLRHLGSYQAAINTINELPSNSKVQFIWEPRSYGCHNRCQADVLLDTFYHATRYQNQDAATIANGWVQQGITHVLINRQGLIFQAHEKLGITLRDDRLIYDELLNTYLAPVDSWNETHTLYQLTVSN